MPASAACASLQSMKLHNIYEETRRRKKNNLKQEKVLSMRDRRKRQEKGTEAQRGRYSEQTEYYLETDNTIKHNLDHILFYITIKLMTALIWINEK